MQLFSNFTNIHETLFTQYGWNKNCLTVYMQLHLYCWMCEVYHNFNQTDMCNKFLFHSTKLAAKVLMKNRKSQCYLHYWYLRKKIWFLEIHNFFLNEVINNCQCVQIIWFIFYIYIGQFIHWKCVYLLIKSVGFFFKCP